MDYFRSYHTVDGEIISSCVDNQTPVALMTDALGSVIRTESQYGGANFRYTAYGKLMKSTPGYTDFQFGWVGSLGYRETNVTHAEQYVRARHYSSTEARWTTIDPLWPEQRPYNYANVNPTSAIDMTGRAILPILCTGACILTAGCALGVWLACKDWRGAYNSFGDCAWEFIDSLPWLQRAGCAIGIGGCISCLASLVPGVVGTIGPWLPPVLAGGAPFAYGYGNCCGFFRKCSGCETINHGAINCADRACAVHDNCLGTFGQFINPIRELYCNRQLCASLGKCADGGCQSDGGTDLGNCVTQAHIMRSFYCTLAGE